VTARAARRGARSRHHRAHGPRPLEAQWPTHG